MYSLNEEELFIKHLQTNKIWGLRIEFLWTREEVLDQSNYDEEYGKWLYEVRLCAPFLDTNKLEEKLDKIYNDEDGTVEGAQFLESQIECIEDIIIEQKGNLFFNTKEELMEYYNQIVGWDGPTTSNSYDGPCRIYAACYNPNGEFFAENT